MEIKFFTDLIDALGKVSGGLLKLPKSKREAMRRPLEETYRLIDTTLNMVIIQLGDIQLKDLNREFLKEASRLDNDNDWLKSEREFRLCQSLRTALRESETLSGTLTNKLFAKDWEALLHQMKSILASEREVASFIGQQLLQLATAARSAGKDAKRTLSVRDGLAAFRGALIAERQLLIKQELELFDLV